MDSFVSIFCEFSISSLETTINAFARKKSLNIVSVSITENNRGKFVALVAFSKKEKREG